MDNYERSLATIRTPPGGILECFRFLGPGFILSASIVGSGELIATTTLGARAGFVAFWVIIVSCLVKVAVQLEFARHAILTGETSMRIFNRLPGPRIRGSAWSLWLVFALLVFKFVQLGGMIGGSGIILSMLFPQIPVMVSVLACAVVSSLLIYRGFYAPVERVSLVMIGLFTILTLVTVMLLQFTGYSISPDEILSGLSFRLPKEILAVAFGAFGITGVASDEIIAYNYWCLEKGYAAYTGPRDNTRDWELRARGWIRVMYVDAFTAMVIYTIVTAAFYLLGAAVLHERGLVPAGNALVETVAVIYTDILGREVRTAYLVGAFFVLFSSVFATLAAWTRIYTDIFGQLRWIDFADRAQRWRCTAWIAWLVPLGWSAMYFLIDLPVAMILFGGVVGSVMLLVVAWAAVSIFRQRADWLSGAVYTIAFWISITSIVLVALYGILSLFNP